VTSLFLDRAVLLEPLVGWIKLCHIHTSDKRSESAQMAKKVSRRIFRGIEQAVVDVGVF
jgi:hypothetical protein